MTPHPKPLALPACTILYGVGTAQQELLAAGIGSLDTGLEFVDLLDPLYDATRNMFFDFGKVDCQTDIRDPDTMLPIGSMTAENWVDDLRTLVRDRFGFGGLAELACARLDADPVPLDRFLFLNVTLPEEARRIAREFGEAHTLVLKQRMAPLNVGGRTITFATATPDEMMKQLRNELGDLF